MKLTPLKIHMLIHFYSLQGPFPNIECNAQQEALLEFNAEGLTEYWVGSGKVNVPLTKKGTFFVKMLLDTPLPVAVKKTVYLDPRSIQDETL
jgi:hypothetical protein